MVDEMTDSVIKPPEEPAQILDLDEGSLEGAGELYEQEVEIDDPLLNLLIEQEFLDDAQIELILAEKHEAGKTIKRIILERVACVACFFEICACECVGVDNDYAA